MNTVAYSAFNENSKQYLDRAIAANQEIILLKNRKPIFKISPFSANKIQSPLKDSIVFEEDIVSPIDEKWESE